MAIPTTIGGPTSALPRRRFTVSEYYKLAEAGILTEDDRVELIEEDLIEMTPIGRRRAAAVDRADDVFRAVLGARARVRIQNPIRLAEDTEPQPDVTVCQPREYEDGHPTPADIFLVVEVADSRVERERVKLLVYARAGVREAWLVDLTTSTIEVHRGPAQDGYRTLHRLRRDDTVTIEAFPDLQFSASSILR